MFREQKKQIVLKMHFILNILDICKQDAIPNELILNVHVLHYEFVFNK